ncbi:HD-domain/PDEase-like protein [Russula ochroleuca]|uniref:HD-domain/PDEase-like protein n=1 Tax=Russula ochroleuca TaxID=152965 RepID=A0A9P5N3A6_9AGAM|nr:HD-domain/PDEase-like protein [Russula ochroleuca]
MDVYPTTTPLQRMRKADSMRAICDNVHGYVTMGPHVWKVVDTKHFQRLRHIKQLGLSYYVWPGASHNRFEHSLGVAYLARQMVMHLKDSQPELGITDRDVKCVELAGLCHDLGHGPWSHVWDGIYIPSALKAGFLPKDRDWRHEDASEMMFDDMMEQYDMDIPRQDVEFIKALIAGDQDRCSDEKPFLFEIVSNKRNGIDVDKFDYIARDTRAIGENQNLSLIRLINSARVIEDQICYHIKDANQIYELCYTRFSLHKRIYNHKTVKEIENMIVDAMLAAEPYLKIASYINDPKKYLGLTDDIRTEIQRSQAPELLEAQRILERIQNRDLYRCVEYKVFDWEHRELLEENITAAGIVAATKAEFSARVGQPAPGIDPEINEDDVITAEDIEDLTPDKVIVTFSTMHYGMKDKNPLDFVKFYPKSRPNECSHARRGDLSLLMPKQFGEVLLRVFTKDIRFFGIVQSGYRSLLTHVTQSEPTSIDLQGSESDGIPEPERPRTPRTASRVSSFNKSFSVESGEGGENGSPFLNQFTTVSKGYGKSLAHPTSPTKIFGPLPVSAPVSNLALEPLESEDHSMVAHPPLQEQVTPTAAKREPKIPAAACVGADNSPRGIAGGVDSTAAAVLPNNPSPSRGLRSSKRLREDRGKDSNVKELSGNGSTPSKRRKA